MRYVKNGPKVDSTNEPQYETCAEVKITESDYAAGEHINSDNYVSIKFSWLFTLLINLNNM